MSFENIFLIQISEINNRETKSLCVVLEIYLLIESTPFYGLFENHIPQYRPHTKTAYDRHEVNAMHETKCKPKTHIPIDGSS